MGPLTLVCGFIVAALLLFGEAQTVTSIGMCTLVVASAPLAAGCVASTLYRWCLPSVSGRLVMNVAGLLAVLAILSDEPVLSNYVRVATTAPSVTNILSTLSVASVVGILSASIVMLAVLIVEVPARWFVSREDGPQWEAILRTVRLIGTVAVVAIGWGIIDEFVRARLSEFFSMFS